jgi:polysaccharide biosynthesis/export protein
VKIIKFENSCFCRIIFILFIVFCCSTIFTSCYNYKKLRLLQEDDSSLPVYEKSEIKDYRIEVNDEILFRLITADETVSKLISPSNGSANSQMQISYRVYTDSTIDIPFVSHIKVAGLTFKEASNVIQKRIKELIPDAEVKVALANKVFTLVGDAGSGSFPIYKDRLTIYQALSMVGDLGEQIDKAHITIVRESKKRNEILQFDIRPKSIIDSKYYYIYPNDIIYIRRSYDSFYKVNSYSALLGVINFSITLFLTVLNFKN